MIDYSTIYERVDAFLQTREGLANPKNTQDYVWFVRELTGIFCGAAHEHNLNTDEVLKYFDMVQQHEITGLVDDGKLHDIADHISTDITDHPLYHITEFTLMNYKPGNVQVGPGEFFLCFYDRSSVFGIDNQNGFDVIVDGVATELKKLGSNFTDAALFDKYAESNKVDRLMVMKPVSNAKRPLQRTKYAVVTFAKTNWREVFTHTGKAGTLSLVS